MNSPTDPYRPAQDLDPKGRTRRWQILVVAAMIATAALVGAGLVAGFGGTEAAADSPTRARIAQPRAQPAQADSECESVVTLTQGAAAEEVADAVSSRADMTVSHAGTEISVVTEESRITAGAMIADGIHMRVVANNVALENVLDFMRSGIDHDDDDYDVEEDLVAKFRTTDCELDAAFDEDATIDMLFDYDMTLSFETDEGGCEIMTSGLAEKGESGPRIDLEKLDLDDIEFDDLSFSFEDGGFSIGATTQYGDVSVDCFDLD